MTMVMKDDLTGVNGLSSTNNKLLEAQESIQSENDNEECDEIISSISILMEKINKAENKIEAVNRSIEEAIKQKEERLEEEQKNAKAEKEKNLEKQASNKKQSENTKNKPVQETSSVSSTGNMSLNNKKGLSILKE